MTTLPDTTTSTNGKRRVQVGRPQGDLDETFRLAQALSQSNLLPQALRGKPSDVLVSILYGQELDLAPMQAIQAIYVVQGRPTISAHLWVALARRHGHRVNVTDETTESCTVEITRGDDPNNPVRATYTLEQAKQAGLTSKDSWKSNRAAMLYARAATTACRRACPEIALGFREETEVDEPDPEPRPTLAQVAAERDEPQPTADSAGQDDKPLHERDDVDDAEMAAEVARLEAEHADTDEQPHDALWFEGSTK